MSLNMSKLFWLLPGFSIYLIILDIWQSFEYASGIKYAKDLNMPQYIYNNITIIVTSTIVLELLPAWFVHPGGPQLTFLSFFKR